MARSYRCTQCGNVNDKSWKVTEVRQRFGKMAQEPPKTTTIPCSACDDRTVQNEMGR